MTDAESRESKPHKLADMVESLLASYQSDARTHHLDSEFLPSRAEIVEIIGELRELLFPGFFSRQRLTAENIRYHVGELLNSASTKLHRQAFRAMRYRRTGGPCAANPPADDDTLDAKVAEMVATFLSRLPDIRKVLAQDVQAAYDGDPAAKSLDEIIFAYPGLVAVSTYRLAHELLLLGVPLIPRIMTEWAHSVTGIDIHPGATIGRGFFIDHGTGVVIGETAHIGNNVRLYQSVTLGAINFPRDENGQLIRGQKRHPTIEDDVTVYSGTSILGGGTFIGRNAVIGGNVFLTKSVGPNMQVALKAPELKVRERHDLGENATPPATAETPPTT
jgi:serine O-acetyltransferase